MTLIPFGCNLSCTSTLSKQLCFTLKAIFLVCINIKVKCGRNVNDFGLICLNIILGSTWCTKYFLILSSQFELSKLFAYFVVNLLFYLIASSQLSSVVDLYFSLFVNFRILTEKGKACTSWILLRVKIKHRSPSLFSGKVDFKQE